jgi:hypothetical protein
MPLPDPKDGLIKTLPEVVYKVMIRVIAPLEKEDKVDHVIRQSLGARKVSKPYLNPNQTLNKPKLNPTRTLIRESLGARKVSHWV